MTKKGAKKTPALLARQEKHNRERREARATAAHLRFTVPREGAREELIHKLVSGCIRRLLHRKRNNIANKARGNPNGAARTAAWHAQKRKEAEERGMTYKELLAERKRQHAEKPVTFSNPDARHKERIATDPAYKITCNLRTRLGEFMRLKNGTKAVGTMELVGCSQVELLAHLQRQIPKGESLLDYSTDHIFPMSRYDATDPEEQRMMMHYSNMQPLKLTGKGGNISKNNRLPTKAVAARVERWAWPPGIDEAQLDD